MTVFVEAKDYLVSIQEFTNSGLIPRGSFFRAQCGKDPNNCAASGKILFENNTHCFRCLWSGRLPLYNVYANSLTVKISLNGRGVYCGVSEDLLIGNKEKLEAESV